MLALKGTTINRISCGKIIFIHGNYRIPLWTEQKEFLLGLITNSPVEKMKTFSIIIFPPWKTFSKIISQWKTFSKN
jgi:hypothetical protein